MKSSEGDPAKIRAAEFVSLAISVCLLLAVVIYLVIQMLEPSDHYNEIRITPILDRAVQRGAGFILPVEIENLGHTTLANVAIRAEPLKPGENPHDFSLDYLGAKAKETVFVLTESDPRQTGVRIKALHYQIE